ncbi:phosphoribosylformylglycinamidine synthase subunit PurS [Coprothermobacter platensis]|uniref:phosphoribosylformylglycinamidine synthase subunit PurS n=1 Tax=Coprothermobacter platensis TaxID=108819 RepID=UPI000377CA7D|nr:phosphoribosylformylglycinamidine synthase subunit PurS [Coprothermobacter platensis]
MAHANVYVTLKKDILDPQGEAVKNALHTLGYKNVMDVRVGKYIVLTLENNSENDINAVVEEISKKVLSNPVIEDFSFDIVED